MPPSSRDAVRVTASAHMKHWLEPVLCEAGLGHNYKVDKVLKVLRIYPRSNTLSSLPLCLCDANYKILAFANYKAIAAFERKERRRVTQNLLNSEIMIHSFTIRFYNDDQVQGFFDGLKFKQKASLFPGYLVLEINDFSMFNRDQLILSNAGTIEFLYGTPRYIARFIEQEFSDEE
ncbi:hypothetical protein KL918_002347 [Ogataea parapolymorpha]|uniref:Telomere replication protein EST3 n=1 Tax=Ogataea parapolymorpha (strain ATCC 26012 / BCRC 20466 / JCM 22074 / NRRL Y-7560 / DL-1) TaxID=871575 RepID=W1QJK4_OGAPD|nr:hypothetical protein HPODL_02192 [Ogataea parapolymorpha DL-1]ESX02878.1 hypothetical protein HPODL_02192 [Ogataea parapolymorpha DL-1]KAG7867750.1 hypothetical protein KL918_002347 [Ogataea parapolymorpha]KAG7870443.1 hypothetical protein KL916_005060 [Ogataea parapolymorpha]